MLNQKSILVTGGTGSFGKKFIQTVLTQYPGVRELVIYSRDEFKQYEISKQFPNAKFPQLSFKLGDVRDYERLLQALEGIDIVIHAAALKQVDTSERNPMEFIKTNVLGADNLIKAAKQQKVSQVVAISSDKAVLPVSLYGATKLCADKLFLAEGTSSCKFTIVRYGNVIGARGSVIPLFIEQAKKQGFLTITDPKMTRFLMPEGSEVDLVLKATELGQGKDIFVAKCPAVRLQDLAQAICPSCPQEIIGLRPGEKLYEEMIGQQDAPFTLEGKDYFVTLPQANLNESEALQAYSLHYQAQKVSPDFVFHSSKNLVKGSENIRQIFGLSAQDISTYTL